MENMDRHEIRGPNICTTDRNRPLNFSFEEFEAWLKAEWDVAEWRFRDWRETPDPEYEFTIRWSCDASRRRDQVTGLLPYNRLEIAWRDGCPADFALDFVRKFVARFPANVDHMCFHDGDAGFAPYEPDLTDEDLYDRMRGDPRTLNDDLQRRIIASYSGVENS